VKETATPLAKGKAQMGELEAAVMGVLWDRGGWSTPGEVHEVLVERRALTYTTVMTILVRLWQKGRLRRERDGRAFAYRPVHSREEEAAARMSEVLTKSGNRPEALSFFLESLSASDRAQLRRLLKDRTPEG
jgi:predicted transcriptional regulator